MLKFKLMALRLLALGLLALAVVTTISLAYQHYTGLLSTLEIQTANLATKDLALAEQTGTIDAQEEVIEDWRQAQTAWITTVEKLDQVNQEAKSENRRLNDIFARHNLGLLARARPRLIERRINDGTDAAHRMRECASGSKDKKCTNRGGEADRAPTPPASSTN